MIIFEAVSKLKKEVRLTDIQLFHILLHHPEMVNQENKMLEALRHPQLLQTFYENTSNQKILTFNSQAFKFRRSVNKSEIKGLLKFCKIFNLNEATVITKDEETEKSFGGVKIKFIPSWLYLLQS